MTSPAALRRLAWAATLATMTMYVAYLDQIARNLHGEKGSVVQPACACLCCTLWMLLGWGRRPHDWPLVVANLPGLVLGLLTIATAL